MPGKPLPTGRFLPRLRIAVAGRIAIGRPGSHAMRQSHVDQAAEGLEAHAAFCSTEMAEELFDGETGALDLQCRRWKEEGRRSDRHTRSPRQGGRPRRRGFSLPVCRAAD